MTLTDETRSLTAAQWETERFGQVCTQPENFGNWKAAILKLCKVPGNRCTYDAKKKVIEFAGKMDGFIETTEKVKIQYPYLNEGEYHDPL